MPPLIYVCIHEPRMFFPTASKRHRSPSPALNSPSNILHVEHLTRPFTLVQLKQLLADDGPLLKDGFWTNNVKSHCIAVVRMNVSFHYII